MSTRSAPLLVALTFGILALTACGPRLGDEDGTGTKAARNGAGAALGSLVYGVIMDDPQAMRQAVATGAAVATTTAVVEGTTTTKSEATQERWEQAIGRDNADAVVCLVNRDYPGTRKNLAKAKASTDPTQQLAALWVETLLARDIADDAAEAAGIERIIATDPKTPDKATAMKKLGKLTDRLAELRSKHG